MPPEKPPPRVGTGAGQQVDQAGRQGQPYPAHDPGRCYTCSGYPCRDVITDAWLAWGRTYHPMPREAVAA